MVWSLFCWAICAQLAAAAAAAAAAVADAPSKTISAALPPKAQWAALRRESRAALCAAKDLSLGRRLIVAVFARARATKRNESERVATERKLSFEFM